MERLFQFRWSFRRDGGPVYEWREVLVNERNNPLRAQEKSR